MEEWAIAVIVALVIVAIIKIALVVIWYKRRLRYKAEKSRYTDGQGRVQTVIQQQQLPNQYQHPVVIVTGNECHQTSMYQINSHTERLQDIKSSSVLRRGSFNLSLAIISACKDCFPDSTLRG